MMIDYSHISMSKSIPQLSFKKGLEIFEENGYNARVYELWKVLIRKVCIKILKKKHQRENEKQRTNISYVSQKERGQKNESKRLCQWLSTEGVYLTDESSLPIVLLYLLMLSYVMDAMEGIKVIVCDIRSLFTGILTYQ